MSTPMLEDFIFDLASYARRGTGRRDCLTPTQKQQIARTVGRTPDVMVKVLPQGASDLATVRRHLDYIGRRGEVELETDDGQTIKGTDMHRGLLGNWDLELDALRQQSDLRARPAQQAPRLVHKLVFSMPPGTSPKRVLQATQNFCRAEFALQHRYAMALHTDEAHPHVHVVLKAVNEEGRRLHIRKATLREWREGFARELRAAGVPANATSRYVRGEDTPRKLDAIYRASLRHDSTHMRARTESVAAEMKRRGLRPEPAKAQMTATRHSAKQAWWSVSEILIQEGQLDLAAKVQRFAKGMPPSQTERERLRRLIESYIRTAPDTRETDSPTGRRLPYLDLDINRLSR